MLNLHAPAPISRTWAASLILLFAVFISAILMPGAEAWGAIVAAIAAALAFTGFRHRPFTIPGLIADAIVFLLALAMVVAALVHRFASKETVAPAPQQSPISSPAPKTSAHNNP